MGEFECPNGHEFPRIVAVPCDECGAMVTCEPTAAGMRLASALDQTEADLDRERKARRVVDRALETVIRERTEVRLFAEKLVRSSDADTRMIGADVLQILADA